MQYGLSLLSNRAQTCVCPRSVGDCLHDRFGNCYPPFAETGYTRPCFVCILGSFCTSLSASTSLISIEAGILSALERATSLSKDVPWRPCSIFDRCVLLTPASRARQLIVKPRVLRQRRMTRPRSLLLSRGD